MAIPPLEWDDAKRARTLAERGVDFAAFGVFWDGRPFVEESDPRHDLEKRSLRFARLDGRLFLVVWTPRGRAVRIISARRANDREERKFGSRVPRIWRIAEPRRFRGYMAMDWAKIDATTDEEIARQIAEDPDTAPELTDAFLLNAVLVVNGVARSYAEVMREAGTPLDGDPLATPPSARAAGEG